MKIIGLILSILMLCSSIFAQEAQITDEIGDITCDDYLLRMYNVNFGLINDLTSKVYILIYEGKEWRYNAKKDKTESVLPAYGSAKARIRSIKQYFKTYKQEDLLQRIVFVEAGFRENFAVEFWFAPNGASAPKPTPTLTKMKYRKGKPKEFCVICC
ncbi:MAG TPA: hypothetical protein PKY82_17465 [Pyrinomonadaceae bacterium]|nr:hypothetical protein [Pyrinomonadaceae bacterium]